MRQLDHLTIFVRDVKKSRDWYTNMFGLEVEFEVVEPKAVALVDDGDFTLFVEQRPAAECMPCCVLTFRVDSVDAVAAELVNKGTKVTGPQKLFWGYGAELRDPDGYLLRIWDEKSMEEKS
jgi:catechol 2,3-dioxygenase-like lactoylglutathione lyase family enzyme